MLHLKSILVRKWPSALNREFPFNLAIVQSLREIEFTAPVTFLVGENGSGKSTLLEAIACAVGAITVGSENARADKTLNAARKLSQHFKLSWQKRTHQGFFLRAEDFFGYAKRLAQMRQEMEDEIKAVDAEYEGRSATAKGLAKMAFARELHDMRRRYGEGGLDSYSHGESFLAIEKARFGKRLQVKTEIDESAKSLLVPPMILQPLAENAVRHGIAPKEEGGELFLCVQKRDDHLEVEVADNGVGVNGTLSDNLRNHGRGLHNTDLRLRKMFGEASRLQVSHGKDGFRVQFKIPVNSVQQSVVSN